MVALVWTFVCIELASTAPVTRSMVPVMLQSAIPATRLEPLKEIVTSFIPVIFTGKSIQPG